MLLTPVAAPTFAVGATGELGVAASSSASVDGYPCVAGAPQVLAYWNPRREPGLRRCRRLGGILVTGLGPPRVALGAAEGVCAPRGLQTPGAHRLLDSGVLDEPPKVLMTSPSLGVDWLGDLPQDHRCRGDVLARAREERSVSCP